MYRQGDILFVPVAKAEGAKGVKTSSILVAEGEATGHHHVLHAQGNCGLLEYTLTQDEVDRRFIEIVAANSDLAEKAASLTHQEHATIDLPAGIYEVRRQREYAPEQNSYVAD